MPATRAIHERTRKQAIFWIAVILCCACVSLLCISFYRDVAYYGARDFSKNPTSWPFALGPGWKVRHVLLASLGVLQDGYLVRVPDARPGIRVEPLGASLLPDRPWVPRICTSPQGFHTYSLPLWIPAALFGLLAWWFRRALHRPRPGFCRICDYDLTGNTSGVCPECGAEIPKQDGASGAARRE